MKSINAKWADRYQGKTRRSKRRAIAEEAEALRLHRRTLLAGLFARTAHNQEGAETARVIARLAVPKVPSF